MSAIIFNENSPLLPVTIQKVDKLRETLINDKLTPWRWFNFRGVDIADFYGRTICLKGMVYGAGTEMLVFFSFIGPFLKDAIVKILDETIETCRVRGLKPEEPYIREAAMVLSGHLINPIYDEMADIDRHLRGKGNPKSVPRRDVTELSAEIIKFLNETKDEMIRVYKDKNKLSVKTSASTKQNDITTEKWYRNRTIQAALISVIALIVISAIGWFLNSHSKNLSISSQKNDSTFINADTKGNLSPAVVTYGPNSQVNIYQTSSQSDVNSK
jgi:hypothetical protein